MNNNTLLIIGLQYPEPTSTAAGSRMIQIMRLLQSYGYIIHFATANPQTQFSTNLNDLGIEQHQLALNTSLTNTLFKNINPDIVLFDRFITEEQFGWRIDESCPDALKVLDTEDLHFLREAREQSLKVTSEAANPIKLSEKTKRELAAIYRSDLTLMISQTEIDILTKDYDIPKNLLFYLPFVYDTKSLSSLDNSGFSVRSHYMSIGNFKHKPNLDMVMFLYKAIWPNIRSKLKDAQWHIYGAYLPEQVRQLHQPQKGIIVKGRAEDVLTTMSLCKVMLAPLRFGAGLKGKCLDAMRAGLPSVTTPIGAEGISLAHKWPGFVAEDAELFAKNAIKLYQNENLWTSKQLQGFEILKKNFDIKTYSKDFQATLAESLQHLNSIRQQNIVGELLKHHHHRSTKFMSLWIEEKNRH